MKNKRDQKSDFGRRLARLRKAEGYTQVVLAEKLSVSQRMIAYYETESEHPPVNLLVDLSHVLNTSTDELLGVERKDPFSKSQLMQKLRETIELDPTSQERLISLVDAFLKKELSKHQKLSE